MLTCIELAARFRGLPAKLTYTRFLEPLQSRSLGAQEEFQFTFETFMSSDAAKEDNSCAVLLINDWGEVLDSTQASGPSGFDAFQAEAHLYDTDASGSLSGTTTCTSNT